MLLFSAVIMHKKLVLYDGSKKNKPFTLRTNICRGQKVHSNVPTNGSTSKTKFQQTVSILYIFHQSVALPHLSSTLFSGDNWWFPYWTLQQKDIVIIINEFIYASI